MKLWENKFLYNLYKKHVIVILLIIDVLLLLLAFLSPIFDGITPVWINVSINIINFVFQVLFIKLYYDYEKTGIMTILLVYGMIFLGSCRLIMVCLDIVPIWFKKCFFIEASVLVLFIFIKICKIFINKVKAKNKN